MRKALICLISALILFPTSIGNVKAKEVANNKSNQTPTLNAYQVGNHAKLEWAIEMLDEDVLYQTGFEANDELPRLTYNASGNRQYGGQSFATEDKFSGNRSLKIVDSYSNGNYQVVDMLGNVTYQDYSAAIFSARKYMENGTDLSVSFRAKTNGSGIIHFWGNGGRADFGEPINITFLEKVNRGDRTAKVSNPGFFKNYVDRGQYFYLANMKGNYTGYIHVVSVDMQNSTITVNAPFQGDFEKGDSVLRHNHRAPVSFNARTVEQKNGWTLFNVNTKVANFTDYNTLNRGFEMWIRTTTHNTVYIDDLKLGYATKAQLFRGNKKLYEGFLSDFTDTEATDKAKPNKVESYTVQKENDKFFITFRQPKDNGTSYEYSVKAVANDGTFYTSDKETVEITSGFRGYSYVIDRNPNTTPSGTVNSTTGKIEIPITANEDYFLHIQAIDNVGNRSDISHFPLKHIVEEKIALTVPTINPIGNIVLKENATTYRTSFESPFKIMSYYQQQNSIWRLNVSASPLKAINSGYELPRGSISLYPLSSIKRIEGSGSLPVNRMADKQVIDNGQKTVVESVSNQGTGIFELTFPKDSLEILIDPTTAKPGTYKSTLTWELVNAP